MTDVADPWGCIPLCPLLLPQAVSQPLHAPFAADMARLEVIAAAVDRDGLVPPKLGAEAYALVSRWLHALHATAVNLPAERRRQMLHVWMTLDEALDRFKRDQDWKEGRGPFSLRCRLRNNVATTYHDICPKAALALLSSVVAMAGNDIAIKAAGLTASAAVHVKEQEYAEAERLYLDALSLATGAAQPHAPEMVPLLATAHNGLATIAANRGDILAAAKHRRKAAALLETAGAESFGVPGERDVHLSKVLQNLAVDLGAVGERERILGLYDRAVELSSRHRSLDEVESAILLRNRATHLGILAEETGNAALFQRARADLDRAVASLSKHPERQRDLARAQALRGDLARAEGALGSALADLEAALKLIAQTGSLADQGNTWKQYADALTEAGRHGEARTAYAKALELLKRALPSTHPEIAQARGNLGVAMLRDGAAPHEASGLLGAAIAGYIQFIDREAVGPRAGIPPKRRDIERHVDARLVALTSQMSEAQAARRTIRDLASGACGLLVEARHFAEVGETGSAAVAWTALLDVMPKLVDALQRADLLAPDAVAKLHETVSRLKPVTENGRTEMGGKAMQMRSLTERDQLAQLVELIGMQAVTALHHRGERLKTEFFETIQVGKLDRTGSAVLAQARRLGEEPEGTGSHRPGEVPTADEPAANRPNGTATEQVEALRRYELAVTALGEAEWRLDQARAADVVDDTLLAGLRTEAERRQAKVIKTERAIDPVTLAAATRGMHPLPMRDAMELLRPDEAILVLRTSEDTTFVAMAWPTSNGPSLRLATLPGLGRERVRAAVRMLRHALERLPPERPVLAEEAGTCLRELLPENIAEALTHRSHVFVVAGGALDLVPLHLLPVGDMILLDLVAVSTLPSVAALAALRSRRPSPSVRRMASAGDPTLWHLPCSVAASLGYSIPDLGPHRDVMCLGRLPGVQRLVADAGTLLPVAWKLLGADATKGNLFARDFTGVPLVLFATHGLTRGVISGQDEAALVLTPKASEPGEDGLLPASQIARLPMHDVSLVIVAACDSAASDDLIDGEGFTGLARAFFQAGARAIVVSHWTVDVSATLALMHRMLAAMAAEPPVPAAEALKAAMLELRSGPQFSAPYFWAPFVVLGDGRTALPP
jgi:CHAT domain-containing protein/tetratricopeptide (TPR) repeat protein